MISNLLASSKANTNHATIDFNVNVFTLFIFVKLRCGSNGSLVYLCIFKRKFLDEFFCILSLIDEDPIAPLLDLESKKIIKLPHYTHFKLFLHAWFKILTKLFISRFKMISSTYICNIKISSSTCFVNEVVSTLPLTKSFKTRKLESLSYQTLGACFKPNKALSSLKTKSRCVGSTSPGVVRHSPPLRWNQLKILF